MRDLAASEKVDALGALIENASDHDWKGLYAVSLLKKRSKKGLLSPEDLGKLAAHSNWNVRLIATEDHNTPTQALIDIAAGGGFAAEDGFFALRKKIKSGKLSPEEQEAISKHPKRNIRTLVT